MSATTITTSSRQCDNQPGAPARLAPHSIEAEEAVLGSVLIDPTSYDRVRPFISADNFFLVKHQWTWTAFTELVERRAPIDLVTVCEELERCDRLSGIGGPAFISHLLDAVPTALHVEGYGRIVEAHSLRRRLIAAASDIAQMAYEEAQDIDEVIAKSRGALYEVRPRDEQCLVDLPQAIGDYYSLIEQRYERRGELLGIPTGLTLLDRMTGGLQNTDLVILAARPGVGKTSLLLNIGLNAVLAAHRRVAILSLEMSREQVTQRIVAQTSGIDSQRLRNGQLTEDDWTRFVETSSHLATNGHGLWIDSTPALSPFQALGKLRWLQAQHGLDLVIVDYLQLMAAGRRFENRVQEVSHLSRSLKQMAGELGVPVLVASQMSRAVEQRADKLPLLSDLRESGSIEQDADMVMFLHQHDELTGPPAFDLIVAKQRNGPVGTVPLVFLKHLTRFVSAERREVEL